MIERVESLLTEMLAEQRQTNQLLLMLIEALSDDSEPGEEPVRYMDGTQIR